MEGSMKDLSDYRMECAKENLNAAILLLDNGQYKASVNRSYYAAFHALRAVTALDNFDSSKHSGVIAYFNHNYVKSGIFDKRISKLIDSCYRMREKADYQDFFIVSKEAAKEQITKAQEITEIIKQYLSSI